MNTSKKKAIRSILFFCLILLISMFAISNLSNLNALAAENITLEEGNYIYDKTELLEEDVKSKLNELLVDLADKTDAEFYVVLVKETDGQEFEEYAKEMFSKWQLGKENVLLLVSENDNDAMLIVGNELKASFDEADCDQFIESEFKTNQSAGYTVITENIVNEIIPIFEEKYDVEIEGPTSIWTIVLIVIIILGVIIVLLKLGAGIDVIELIFEIIVGIAEFFDD